MKRGGLPVGEPDGKVRCRVLQRRKERRKQYGELQQRGVVCQGTRAHDGRIFILAGRSAGLGRSQRGRKWHHIRAKGRREGAKQLAREARDPLKPKYKPRRAKKIVPKGKSHLQKLVERAPGGTHQEGLREHHGGG